MVLFELKKLMIQLEFLSVILMQQFFQYLLKNYFRKKLEQLHLESKTRFICYVMDALIDSKLLENFIVVSSIMINTFPSVDYESGKRAVKMFWELGNVVLTE